MTTYEFRLKYKGAWVGYINPISYVATSDEHDDWFVIERDGPRGDYDMMKPIAHFKTQTQARRFCIELYQKKVVQPKKQRKIEDMIKELESLGYKVAKAE